MCEKTNYKFSNSQVDKCMRNIIIHLNMHYALASSTKIRTVACCCGHGKYPMTILVADEFGNVWDIFTNKIIPRTKRFYKRDSEGYYYIQEVIENE